MITVTAESDDGVVMAIEHRALPLAAVQFHPESILTLDDDIGLFRLLRRHPTPRYGAIRLAQALPGPGRGASRLCRGAPNDGGVEVVGWGEDSCRTSRNTESMNEIEVRFGSAGNAKTVFLSQTSQRPASMTRWRIFGSVRSFRNIHEIL